MAMNNLKLEDDQMCFACGLKNPHGLKLDFELDKDNCMRTEFTPQKIHQGFKDIVHGGIIALILDEVMLNLIWKQGKPAVTGKMDVKFKSPCRVGETLHFYGKIKEEEDKIIHTEATAQDKSGKVMATASAKCFKLVNK